MSVKNPTATAGKDPSRYGDPVLPASDPTILKPMEGPAGILQVRPIPDLEDHGLFFRPKRFEAEGLGWTLLAIHPNGYSCHVLAKRILANWADRSAFNAGKAAAQAAYIADCGGLVRSESAMTAAINGEY